MNPEGSPVIARRVDSLAALLGAELVGPPDLLILGLAAIDHARAGDLTFIRSSRFASRWPQCGASAAVVSRGVEVARPDGGRALLLVDDADLAMDRLLLEFAPPSPRVEPGIAPTALVDPTATVGRGVAVGPYSVVGPHVSIADDAVLIAQVYLGAGAKVGRGSILHPGVRVLDRCTIGDDCLLWPNVVIGADGFGYRPSPAGDGLVKVPHIGTVVIGDRVEIGANSAVDRGKFGATTIGSGTKIDNHCQIAHNCVIGESVIICGMAGIAGSVTIGDGAVIAGHVGIADNLRIGPRAVLAAKAGVIGDVPAGETWFGTPAGPHREQLRSLAALRRLPEALRRLDRLDAAVGGRAAPD